MDRYRQVHLDTHTKKDNQTVRLMEREAARQIEINRQTDRLVDKQRVRQSDELTKKERERDRQINR